MYENFRLMNGRNYYTVLRRIQLLILAQYYIIKKSLKASAIAFGSDTILSLTDSSLKELILLRGFFQLRNI